MPTRIVAVLYILRNMHLFSCALHDMRMLSTAVARDFRKFLHFCSLVGASSVLSGAEEWPGIMSTVECEDFLHLWEFAACRTV